MKSKKSNLQKAIETSIKEYKRWDKECPPCSGTAPTIEWIEAMMNLEKEYNLELKRKTER